MATMTLDQFRAAYQAGGLRSIGVVASGSLFFVTGLPRKGEPVTLATTRGKQKRSFRDPSKAIAILHEIGARKVQVDTSEWVPGEASVERRRPDTAERQRRAHAAAAHDAWFRAEIATAVHEADDPATEWMSNQAVKDLSGGNRARWRIQANRGND